MLGSWCDFPSAIPWDDIIISFQDKSKQPKVKGKEVADAEDSTGIVISHSE